MKIRKATQKDVPRIVELLNSDANLTEDDELPYTEKMIISYLKEQSNFMFVYELNSKILGVIMGFFWMQAKQCYMFDIVVDENYRKKGIGKALINYLENMLKKNKIELIFFHSEEDNKIMHKASEKWGYKKGKKSYFFSKTLK